MNDHSNENDEPGPVAEGETPSRDANASHEDLEASAGATLVDPEGVDVVSPPPSALAGPSWRPADYYHAPRSAARFPRWVPLTCGVVAIVAIVFMAVVGAFLGSGGLGKLVAISFGQLNSEAARMFEDDVDEGARAAFSRSLLAVRDGIADGTIELPVALPVLQEMQKATRDGLLSAEEVGALTSSFEERLAAPPPESSPSDPPVVDL